MAEGGWYFGHRFWGSRGIRALPDHRHHGEGKHHKRDMTVPAMPRPGFIMVHAKFVLCGLEAVFDRPAMSFDMNERGHVCPCRAPGGEEGEVTIGDVAPDQ